MLFVSYASEEDIRSSSRKLMYKMDTCTNTHLCSMIKQNKYYLKENKVDLNDILKNGLYNKYIQDINNQINEYNNTDGYPNICLGSIQKYILELLQMYIITNLKIQPSKDMTIGQFKKLCNQLLLPQYNKTDKIFNKTIKQDITNQITDNSKLYETLGIETKVSEKLQSLWKTGQPYKYIQQLFAYIRIKYFPITGDTATEELIEILQLFVFDYCDQEQLKKLKQQLLENNKTKSIQADLGNETNKLLNHYNKFYYTIFSISIYYYNLVNNINLVY